MEDSSYALRLCDSGARVDIVNGNTIHGFAGLSEPLLMISM